MPFFLLGALASSLALHGIVLFGTEINLPGLADEPAPLQAELRLPPPADPPMPVPVVKASANASAVEGRDVSGEKPAGRRAERAAAPSEARDDRQRAEVSPAPLRQPAPPVQDGQVSKVSSPAVDARSASPSLAPAVSSSAPPAVLPSPAMPTAVGASGQPAASPGPPRTPRQPADGVIRYDVIRGSQGFIIGRAEQRWHFSADGQYRLSSVTETSGLVALFKRLRVEYVSEGQLTANGLQPQRFSAIKNGQPGETAQFDWAQGQLHWSAAPAGVPLLPGSQDVLSLNYQLAYLPKPEDGKRLAVFTGRKYERYAIDALGEETLATPAGQFHTLHLRVMTETVTELWLARDHHLLPVKIRFTDKKGDQYEQIARELGT